MKNLRLRRAIKEYIGNNEFKLSSISEKRSEKNGAFLVITKNNRYKANIFEDKEELKNFLNLVPYINEAPRILYHKRNIVLTQWVEGEVIEANNLTSADLKEIAKLQAKIHSIPIRYNKKEVIKRFKKKINLYIYKLSKNSDLNEEEILLIKRKFNKCFPINPRISIIHKDWIAVNLLKTKLGWCSIDNELVEVSLTGFDLGKPLNSICKTDNQRKEYLKAYNKVLNNGFYLKDRDFYQLTYLIKSLYSRLNHKKLPTDIIYQKIVELIK